MKQSRAMSMVEAATNVVVGYVLAIATQIVVFPWFGIETGLSEHLAIGAAFVAVSMARGYLLRRLFEAARARQGRFVGKSGLSCYNRRGHKNTWEGSGSRERVQTRTRLAPIRRRS